MSCRVWHLGELVGFYRRPDESAGAARRRVLVAVAAAWNAWLTTPRLRLHAVGELDVLGIALMLGLRGDERAAADLEALDPWRVSDERAPGQVDLLFARTGGWPVVTVSGTPAWTPVETLLATSAAGARASCDTAPARDR